MKLEIKIQIEGAQAGLSLCDLDSGRKLASMRWEDKRDLSDKLFLKMDAMLRKQDVSLLQIHKVSFDCDSPYFDRNEKWEDMQLENIDGSGKCGFTAWQTGEIIAKVMSFALEKK